MAIPLLSEAMLPPRRGGRQLGWPVLHPGAGCVVTDDQQETVPMMDNPLQPDPAREARIRERAYHMWEQDGRPHGRDREYWERAAELVGMEDSAGAGRLPNPQTHPAPNEVAPGVLVEEADIQQNLGEFPDRLSDQGEHPPTPEARRSPRRKAPSLDNQPPTASAVPELPGAEDTVEDLPDAAGATAKKPARKAAGRKKA